MFCAQIFDIYCWPEKLPFSDGSKMEVVCLTIFDPFIFGIPVILTGVLFHGFYGVIQEDVRWVSSWLGWDLYFSQKKNSEEAINSETYCQRSISYLIRRADPRFSFENFFPIHASFSFSLSSVHPRLKYHLIFFSIPLWFLLFLMNHYCLICPSGLLRYFSNMIRWGSSLTIGSIFQLINQIIRSANNPHYFTHSLPL